MYTIDANTTIAELLKHPEGLELIIGISSKFQKLRNPVLRKLMAKRTTVKMASKIAGCSIHDFFDAFKLIGFVVTEEEDEVQSVFVGKPEWLKSVSDENMIDLDVRPVLASGKDPLKLILSTVNKMENGQVLKVINTFEPMPLISLLQSKGIDSYTESPEKDRIHTYFFIQSEVLVDAHPGKTDLQEWDKILKQFEGRFVEIDVRDLDPPQPMLKILDLLDQLPDNQALFVYHKRIPVFLFPELQELGMAYRLKELSDSEVHLIIYKP